MPSTNPVEGQDHNEVRPCGAALAVAHKDGIDLLRDGRRRLIKLTRADKGLVWAVLEECDGHQTCAQIVDNVCEQFPDRDRQTVQAILADLLEEGALQDSRERFRAFHRVTQNPQPFGRALTTGQIIEYTRSPRLAVSGGDRYALELRDSGLVDLQARRRSCRGFAQRPLGRRELGDLLISLYRVPGGPGDSAATPSGGALYPLKIYLVVARGGDRLPAGYYEYDPEAPACSGEGSPIRRRLVRMHTPVDEETLGYAFDADSGALPHGAPAAVVIAGDMLRHPFKYANRGYRLTHLEAGMALQNLLLAATDMGVASLPYFGFRDEVLARELEMDQTVEDDPDRVLPLVTVALGYRDDAPAPTVEHQVDALEQQLVGDGKPISGVWWAPSHDTAFVTATARTHEAVDREQTMVTAGRARSAAAAKRAALVEGFERYVSGIPRVDRTASARQLSERGVRWLDPRDVYPLSPGQRAAMTWLQPFDPDRVLPWVEGHRAASGQAILVPADTVFYPLHADRWWNRKPVISASSNGVAAYTDEAGATERALLELIERDALMRSWFHRTSPPRIPTELLPYHWRRRVATWERQDRDVHVLDLSAGAHGAVVVEVAITSRVGAQPAFVCGAAASLTSFEDALAKAFMEAQSPIEGIVNSPYESSIAPEHVRSVGDHLRLYSFPEHSQTLAWLFTGEPAGAVPQVHTEIGALLADLDPVVVRLAPLGDKTRTVIPELSAAATELVRNAPLYVVRAISERLIPIHFGQGGGHYTHPTLQGAVAPESTRLPQYFA